jgi:hypothetical protein
MAGQTGTADLSNDAFRLGQTGRGDRVRQVCHLDQERPGQTAAAAVASPPLTASRVASVEVTPDCRQSVPIARVAKRRLMAGTLLTVCDPYALPGSHCPYDACLPI